MLTSCINFVKGIKMNQISPRTHRKILRLVLRSVPFFSTGPELYDLYDELYGSKDSIEKKIDEAYSSLLGVSELIEEIHQELTEKTEKMEKITNEYERYSGLTEIKKEKFKPIRDELEILIKKDKKKDLMTGTLVSLIVGLIIFIFGVFASPLLQSWLGI